MVSFEQTTIGTVKFKKHVNNVNTNIFHKKPSDGNNLGREDCILSLTTTYAYNKYAEDTY